MTDALALPDPALLRQFSVSQPRHVAQTAIANVWKVKYHDGACAALKIYTGDATKDEAPGIDLLAAWNGTGAACLYGRTDAAVLMEWLDGPSLGDMVRAGDDTTATHELVAVANTLHSTRLTPPATLMPLEDRFQALLTARFQADCPPRIGAALRKAAALAEDLLIRQTDIRPLHGDLHHDNIKGSARGYLAFDAKGVLGDRLYEVANAMRNPIGAEAIYTDSAVIAKRADILSAAFNADRSDLLRWAAAHAGLSLAWTFGGTIGTEAADGTKLIDTLLAAIN